MHRLTPTFLDEQRFVSSLLPSRASTHILHPCAWNQLFLWRSQRSVLGAWLLATALTAYSSRPSTGVLEPLLSFSGNGNLHGPNLQGWEEGVPGDTGACNKRYKGVKLGGGTHNPTITTTTIIYTKRREKGEERGEEGGEREKGRKRGKRDGGSKREGRRAGGRERERPSLELMGRMVLCYTKCPMIFSHDKSLRSPLLPATQQHLARAYNPSGTRSRIITENHSKPFGLSGETGTPSIPPWTIGPLPSPEISQIQFLMGARTIFHQHNGLQSWLSCSSLELC